MLLRYCLTHPSKDLLAFKMSWRCLQHIFSVTVFRLSKRFEDISQDILKTSRRLQGVLEEGKVLRWRRLQGISWRHLEGMSWRHLEDILKTTWRRLKDVFEANKMLTRNILYLTNLNVYLTYLYFTNLYLMNLRWIQNALIRTQ